MQRGVHRLIDVPLHHAARPADDHLVDVVRVAQPEMHRLRRDLAMGHVANLRQPAGPYRNPGPQSTIVALRPLEADSHPVIRRRQRRGEVPEEARCPEEAVRQIDVDVAVGIIVVVRRRVTHPAGEADVRGRLVGERADPRVVVQPCLRAGIVVAALHEDVQPAVVVEVERLRAAVRCRAVVRVDLVHRPGFLRGIREHLAHPPVNVQDCIGRHLVDQDGIAHRIENHPAISRGNIHAVTRLIIVLYSHYPAPLVGHLL